MNSIGTIKGPLQNKIAVIFGAGGGLGSGVAREFATQGATVCLSGRALEGIENVAKEIRTDGGLAYTARVDASDESAVNEYLETVAMQHGGIDILLNAMGPQPREYGNATSPLEITLDQFLVPLRTLVPSQFITARTAARFMVKQHSGVILFVTANPATGIPNAASIGAAFGAMESLVKCLAVDLGSSGVRVVGIRSGPMMGTRTIDQSFEIAARTMGITKERVQARFEQGSVLKSSSTVSDTATLAAFLASDAARTITGTIVNANSGRVIS